MLFRHETVFTGVPSACNPCESVTCCFDSRSESGGGLYPTIRREEAGGRDSDEERASGEYYSGEEFHEDDIMLTKDR